MDLKNITMDDLKQKLAAVDKKTLIKFGSGFGAIILFLIIYYVILNPMVKERKAKYNDKILKQNEISQFENEIITFKTRIKPVFKQGVTQQAENNITRDMVSYYQIPVDYEIKGNFLGYIKFKRAVSRQNKMLNFDKETISIVQNDSTGAIMAQGELTIVGLPDEFF